MPVGEDVKYYTGGRNIVASQFYSKQRKTCSKTDNYIKIM